MQDYSTAPSYLFVEVTNLIGEHAVFVRQEAEAPLFFQQCLSAAVGNELLHVRLARRDRFHVLQTGGSWEVNKEVRRTRFGISKLVRFQMNDKIRLDFPEVTTKCTEN